MPRRHWNAWPSASAAGVVTETACGTLVEGLGQPLNLMLARSIEFAPDAQAALERLAERLRGRPGHGNGLRHAGRRARPAAEPHARALDRVRARCPGGTGTPGRAPPRP